MSSCAAIDPLVTPYVDGEIAGAERQLVDDHVQRCAACRSRIDAERAVAALVKARRAHLAAPVAPDHLRARCLAARVAETAAVLVPFQASPGRPRAWARGPRITRMALAASLLVLIGGAGLYRATFGATQAIAAELTADHLKCFMLNGVLRTHDTEADAESFLRATFNWPAQLPDHAETADMTLVGSRWCLYEHGRVAHVMYRHHGVPVSVFMLPGTTRQRALTHALGHDAVVWAEGGRTFVLIARAPRAEVEQVAAFVQHALH